jgi:hypothetical protein
VAAAVVVMVMLYFSESRWKLLLVLGFYCLGLSLFRVVTVNSEGLAKHRSEKHPWKSSSGSNRAWALLWAQILRFMVVNYTQNPERCSHPAMLREPSSLSVLVADFSPFGSFFQIYYYYLLKKN